MTDYPLPPAIVLGCLLAVSASAQQPRPVRIISQKDEIHQDAKISPDGAFVAFKVSGRLGVVDIAGTTETTIYTGSPGEFVWSRSSASLFVADGDRILAVPRSGATPTPLVQLGGQTLSVWDVDGQNALLYCTRKDPSTNDYFVFELAASGSSAPRDLISSKNQLSHVRVDPSGAYLLYRSTGTAPFDPSEYWRADRDGTNRINLAGGTVGSSVQNGDWLDAGDTALFAGPDASGIPTVQRILRASRTVEPLTSLVTSRFPTVSPNRDWIVFAAIDGPGNGPGVMPPTGGGVVFLAPGTGYVYSGSPTIDTAARHVVWSASRFGSGEKDKLFRVDLDREMRVHPRVELGKTFQLELPAATNEIGVIFLGNLGPAPFGLPGVQYPFYLDASFAILTIARGSASAPVSIALPVPNVPALSGVRIWFQGMRWDPVAQVGDFTRHGVFTIF
jgi:Tol biopolymer transport system component